MAPTYPTYYLHYLSRAKFATVYALRSRELVRLPVEIISFVLAQLGDNDRKYRYTIALCRSHTNICLKFFKLRLLTDYFVTSLLGFCTEPFREWRLDVQPSLYAC